MHIQEVLYQYVFMIMCKSIKSMQYRQKLLKEKK